MPTHQPQVAAAASPAPPDVCIFLLQLGGPVDLNGIEPFLANLFADVLPLPGFLRAPLGRLIANRRTPKVRPLYAAMGGGSPLLCNTEAQSGALRAALAAQGIRAHVHVCMRYAPPRAATALAHARRLPAGVPWVVLPLYPHYSFSTSRSSFRELQQLMTATEHARVRLVEAYCDAPAYLDAQAAAIQATLQGLPPQSRASAHVVFSAHGLPMSLIREGDPYAHQVEASVRGLVARLGLQGRHTLAYQSRVGPVRWLQPSTPDVFAALGRAGVREILVVPISFVSEHIETLQELDVELHEVATHAGITAYHRVRTLGTQPQFMAALVEQVQRALAGGRATPELQAGSGQGAAVVRTTTSRSQAATPQAASPA